MEVTRKALEYLKENGIKAVKISLVWTCSIYAKIEVFKEKIDEEGEEIDGILFVLDEDAKAFLDGLILDADEGLFFRAP
ncbi:hypothetical protein Ferp_2028 [Ferroglobus placidus DSM 10642]|uniref:HesB/YadR/YfhF-family protein n=1 Tax=Ferroglobus placidus (strain DSM 10642 / AEDII12DO) TaxID=589924 RepID=D3S0A2_FERPA|nr:hypothetical protein [Ferroglobus placidus]ADC66165.1 hypothetical protein Ferp_2028 [Ferroglobus placidus DSM 10642]